MRRISLGLLMLACSSTHLQGAQPLKILYAPQAVSLHPYAAQGADAVQFGKYFQDPALLRQQPFALVLVNTSGQAITALTLRWRFTDSAGHVHTRDYQTDSYFLGSSRVAPAGGYLLITPSAVLAPATGAGFVGPASARTAHDADEFSQASDVALTVDTLVLENGDAFGPDASQTLASIQARKIAIDRIVEVYRSGQAQGGSDGGKAALASNFGSSSPRNDPVGLWTNRIMQAVQHSAQPDELIQKLSSLPNPQFRGK